MAFETLPATGAKIESQPTLADATIKRQVMAIGDRDGGAGDPLGDLATGQTELKALIGEVQETPTANTLLSRIKGLAVSIGAMADAAWTTGNGSVIALLKTIAGGVTDTSPAILDSGVKFVEVTLSADTAPYASGDLIADTQIIAACVRANDSTGLLQSIQLIDEDNQGVALTLLFFSESASLGTENSAPTYSDTIIRTLLHRQDVATGDYDAYGSVAKVAEFSAIGKAIKPKSGTDDIYVAAVNGSATPTFTAAGLKLRLGFLV